MDQIYSYALHYLYKGCNSEVEHLLGMPEVLGLIPNARQRINK